MTARATSAVLALALAGALTPVAAAPATASRCGGLRATMVSAAKVVRGTFVDDVIVVTGRGSVRVDAGGGDDTVCVRTPKGALVTVATGMGDDVVRVESTTNVIATLDGGLDVYVGGPGRDFVSTGVLGQPNRDRVLLGGGDDRLGLSSGSDHRGATVRGGGGRDAIWIVAPKRLTVDAGRRRATVKGRTFARWTGFEAYEVEAEVSQTFLGTDGPESVSFGGFGSVRARTGGGDDEVELRYWTLDQAPVIDAGSGRDLLAVLVSGEHIVASLVTDRLDVTGSFGPPGGFAFTGVEDLAVEASEVTIPQVTSHVEIVGDDGDDRLQGSGCHVRILGGAGDDHLRVGRDPITDGVFTAPSEPPSCTQTSEVFGEAGDDVLVSRGTTYTVRGHVERPIDDLLDGGDGVDTADAGAGRDTCVAEVAVACEG